MKIEMDKPQTIGNARKKIAQLADATNPGDLIRCEGVVSGWLAALRLEGLLSMTVFNELSDELLAAFRAARDILPADPAAPTSDDIAPLTAAEAIAKASKGIDDIGASQNMPAAQFCFGHALGWIAGARAAGVLDWTAHDALFKQATEALEQWKRTPQG